MKNTLAPLSLALCAALPALGGLSRLSHDREQPPPAVVTPGLNSRGPAVGSAPSDATVLFDGSNLDAWVAMDGSPTKWELADGALQCVPQAGYIRTRQSFGDCQLHIEWATPNPAEGSSQGRGNSGVFFGLNRYEVQVLDSYQNLTYADGSAGSIYGQYAPLVNASLPPGEWQVYDMIYTAPRFDEAGALRSPAHLTVFHNGVLIQNHVELTGPAVWVGRPPYAEHPVKLPLALQDHGNPVRYRNIWVRELDTASEPEYYLAEAALEGFTGKYRFNWGKDNFATVTRGTSGRLTLQFSGFTLAMFAASENEFFAKTADVRCRFVTEEGKDKLLISVGDGWMPTVRVE